MSLLLRIINNEISINKLVNKFCTSSTRNLNQNYRREKKLSANPNRFGPLTNRTDYSFADGRPVPLGVRQRYRLNIQKDYAMRILKLSREVDYAVERHQKMLVDEEMKKQVTLDRKLKSKGDQLKLYNQK